MATFTDARGSIVHFKVNRGERLIIEPEILDVDGDAIDLTGHVVEFVVEDPTGGTLIYRETKTVHEDAVNGKTLFTLSHETTMEAPSSQNVTWYYAIHWKDDSDPDNEDIHSSGTIEVHAVPVRAIA